MFVVFRSKLSDEGVGGYSIDGLPPGRFILSIHGNQYKKTIRTWIREYINNDKLFGLTNSHYWDCCCCCGKKLGVSLQQTNKRHITL